SAPKEARDRRAVGRRKREAVPIALEAREAVLNVGCVLLSTWCAGQRQRAEQRARERPQVRVDGPARWRRLSAERGAVLHVHRRLHGGVGGPGAVEVALHYPQIMADSHDLDRFVDAQDHGQTYAHAVAELRRGRKSSHWMWFVFPQIAGLGSSEMSRAYA